jgi:chromosome segregation ATPase
MGGRWYLQLLPFFTPSIVESYSKPPRTSTGPVHSPDGDDDDNPLHSNASHGPWYEQPGRLKSAILAMETILSSLGSGTATAGAGASSQSYHKMFLPYATELFCSLAHWIIRNGPSEMLCLSFKLLEHFICYSHDKHFIALLFQLLVQYPPSVIGLHVPLASHGPSLALQYSTRLGSSSSITLPGSSSGSHSSTGTMTFPGSNEKRIISLLNLLTERYLVVSYCWYGHDATSRDRELQQELHHNHGGAGGGGGLVSHRSLYIIGNEYWMGSLRVLDRLLAADELTSGMVIQHILAPPPPPPMLDDDNDGGLSSGGGLSGDQETNFLDNSLIDFGSVAMCLLVNALEKISSYANNTATALPPTAVQGEVMTIIRASNIVTLILIHGGLLASELCTALSTHHLIRQRSFLDPSLHTQQLRQQSNQPLLPTLLSLCSRIIRLPNFGFLILESVLKILSAACRGCERATVQVLEDPSNFFLLDLATRASETTGVPLRTQVLCCLFLGSCFDSLPAPTQQQLDGVDAGETLGGGTSLSRKSLLMMIDSKIGLSRFNDLLKRPLGSTRGGGGGGGMTLTGPSSNTTIGGKTNSFTGSTTNSSFPSPSPEDLFFIDSFRIFYLKQIEQIRSAIFDFYSGVGGGSSGVGGEVELSPEGKIIQMQKEMIQKLELELQGSGEGSGQLSNGTQPNGTLANNSTLSSELEHLKTQLLDHTHRLEEKEERVLSLEEKLLEAGQHIQHLETENKLQQEALMGQQHTEEILLQEIHELKKLNEQFRHEAQALTEKYSNTTLPAQSSHLTTSQLTTSSTSSLSENLELQYKTKILQLSSQKNEFLTEIEQLSRKIKLLEDDLRTPLPHDKIVNTKIIDLEERNAILKGTIWGLESQIESLKQENQEMVNKMTAMMMAPKVMTTGTVTGTVTRNEENFLTLKELIDQLVEACDIHEDDNPCPSPLRPSSPTSDPQELLLQHSIASLQFSLDTLQKITLRYSDYAHDMNLLVHTNTNDDEQEPSPLPPTPLLRLMEILEKYDQSLTDTQHENSALLFEKENFEFEISRKENEKEELENLLTLSQEALEKVEKEKKVVVEENLLLHEVIQSLSLKLEQQQPSQHPPSSTQLTNGSSGSNETTDPHTATATALRILQEEFTNQLDENEKLQKQLNEQGRHYLMVEYKYKTENKELKWKLDQCEERHRAHHRGESDVLHSQQIQESDLIKEIMKKEKEMMEIRIQELLNKGQEFENQILLLTKEVEELSSLRHQLVMEQNAKIELRTIVDSLTQEVTGLQETLQETLQRHQEELVSSREVLETEIKRLQREREEKEEGHRSDVLSKEMMLDRVESQLVEEQNANAELRTKLDYLDQQVTGLEETLQETQSSHAREMNIIRAQLEEKEQLVETLSEELEDLRGASSVLESQLKEASEKCAQLQNEHSAVSGKLSETDCCVKQYEVQLESLHAKIEDLTNRLFEAQGLVSDLKEQTVSSENRVEQLTRRHEDELSNLEHQLRSELISKEKALADSLTRNTSLEEQITELNQQLQSLEEDHESTLNTNSELRVAFDLLQQQHTDLQHTLKSVNERVQELEGELMNVSTDSAKRVEKQLVEFQELTRQYEESVREIEMMKQENEKSGIENEMRENTIPQLEEEMKGLRETVEQNELLIATLKRSYEEKLLDYNKLLEKYLKQKELIPATSSRTAAAAAATGLPSQQQQQYSEEMKALLEKIKKLEQNKQEVTEEYNLQMGKLSGYQVIIHNLEKSVEKLLDEKEGLEEEKAQLVDEKEQEVQSASRERKELQDLTQKYLLLQKSVFFFPHHLSSPALCLSPLTFFLFKGEHSTDRSPPSIDSLSCERGRNSR